MRRLTEIRGRLLGWLGARTTPRHRAADPAGLHIVRDNDTPPLDNRNALVQFWRVEDDDEIGGVCVVVNRPGTPATGNRPVCSFIDEVIAGHVAQIHNEWLDDRVRNRR